MRKYVLVRKNLFRKTVYFSIDTEGAYNETYDIKMAKRYALDEALDMSRRLFRDNDVHYTVLRDVEIANEW